MSVPEYRLKTRLRRGQMLGLGAALAAVGVACGNDAQTVAIYGAPVEVGGSAGHMAGTGGTAAGTGGTAAGGRGGSTGGGDSGEGGNSGEGGAAP